MNIEKVIEKMKKKYPQATIALASDVMVREYMEKSEANKKTNR